MNNPILKLRSRGKKLSCLSIALALLCLVTVCPSAPATRRGSTGRASGWFTPPAIHRAATKSLPIERASNGTLTFSASFATGGMGNDVELGGLGNQGGVVLSRTIAGSRCQPGFRQRFGVCGPVGWGLCSHRHGAVGRCSADQRDDRPQPGLRPELRPTPEASRGLRLIIKAT